MLGYGDHSAINHPVMVNTLYYDTIKILITETVKTQDVGIAQLICHPPLNQGTLIKSRLGLGLGDPMHE